MSTFFDNAKFRWACMTRQARLRYLKTEIEDTQARCAQLGAYVGELIAEKSRLEIESHRDDQVLSE